MYHIKSDRRSRTSAEEIVRGMLECLKTTPLKAITVTDLHRVTGISRATFYRLFDTPEDVLHYHYDQLLEQAAGRFADSGASTPQEVFEQTIAAGMEQHEFLKALMDNGRFDLLHQYTERNFRAMSAAISFFPPDMAPIEQEYTISHMAMAMVATLVTWERNGRQETPAEIIKYLKRYAQLVTMLVEK